MEPERPIEKLLRAFAKKRRDEAGAPLELHGATRRLLQAEVARRKAKSQPEGGFFPGLLKWLRPQLAFGLCIIAVLLVGGVMVLSLLNRSTTSQLAQAPTVTDERLGRDNLATAPVAVPAPAPTAPAEGPAELTRSQSRLDQLSADAKKDVALRDGYRTEPAAAPAASAVAGSVTSAVGQGVQLYADAGTVGRKLTEEKESAAQAEVDAERTKLNFSEAVLKKTSPPPSAENRARTPSLAKAEASKRELALAESLADASKLQANGTVTLAQKPPASAPASFGVALQPTPTASATDARSGVGGSFKNVTAQNFAQVVDANKAKDASGNLVLNSFRVEQTGNEIRVVDEDGSTYAGYLQTQDTPASVGSVEGQRSLNISSRAVRPTQTTRRSVVQQKEVSEAQAQKYFFRVTGTNRSLNQPVVFSGDLVTTTNTTVVSTNAPIASSIAGLPIANTNLEQLLLNSRISGKARVGEREEMQINALPVNNVLPSKQ